VAAFHQLTDEAVRDVPGFFAHGPTIDSEFLPRHPVEAMARGDAHRVPLIIGNNADEGRLFTRSLKVMPTSQAHIERLLVDIDAAAQERINVAYPNYPHSDACVRIGGDMCFDSIVWKIAEAHSKHAPTHVYRYDYASRTLSWTGLAATHGTELLAVFDSYRGKIGSLLTVAADRRSALRVSDEVQHRWWSFSSTGRPGDDWPSYAENGRAVMVFDRKSRIELDPAPARRQAWAGVVLTR
jgi:para-nitrobenzyl esterase